MASLHFKNQTKTFNGFWLINFQLDDLVELPIDFSLMIDHSELRLLSQDGLNLQFLAKQAIDSQADDVTLAPSKLTPPSYLRWLGDETETLLFKASDLGIASLLNIVKSNPKASLIGLVHATEAFPFPVKPGLIILPNFPPEAIACCPLLEDKNIPSKLCSSIGLAGCFDGDFVALNNVWQPDPTWRVIEL